MKNENKGPQVSCGREADARSMRLQLAIAAVLAVSSADVAVAQSMDTPYQSSSRATYGDGLGQSALPKGGRFEPRVDTTLQYVSNMTAAPDDEPQVDTAGLEAAPGFYASWSSDTATAAMDYSLVARWWEDSDYNDVSHRLAANGEWHLAPEWFYVTGQASYGNAILDPAEGLNYGGIGVFNPANLSEVATASLSPVLSHKFGDFQAVAQYQYGRTWYLDEGLGVEPDIGFVNNDQDSEDQSARASFGTATDAGHRLTGTVYYDWQKSEYETALPYQYERAGVDMGLRLGRSITLLGEYGQESDLDENTTEGGLDSEYWNGGLRYEPSDQTLIEGRYGTRFFGDYWSAQISHRARLLEFGATYSEEPTVETRRLSLGDFDPGTLPPGLPPGVDFSVLVSSPYVARDASATIRAVGSRTTLSLTGFQYERDYINALRQDETNLGVTFGVNRTLASNLDADFNVTYNDYERTTPGVVFGDEVVTNDKDTTAVLRLNRQTGKSLTLSIEGGYLTRSGDTSEYDGWWTALRARWAP